MELGVCVGIGISYVSLQVFDSIVVDKACNMIEAGYRLTHSR